jgi:uncharacterized membrane protein AbrB (regulator of aidB expression)
MRLRCYCLNNAVRLVSQLTRLDAGCMLCEIAYIALLALQCQTTTERDELLQVMVQVVVNVSTYCHL